MNRVCILKDCRLRIGEEIPEDERNYKEDYPYNTYGDSCIIKDCSMRIEKE